MISNKSPYSRNIDIYGFMNKIQFLLNDLKKQALPPKNDFFSMISKKRSFPRNIEIFEYMDKNDFFKMISKTSFLSIC